MSDEEQKIFTLNEAERTRTEIEPVLLEAMQARRQMGELDEELGMLAARIQMAGGMRFNYAEAAQKRLERNTFEKSVHTAIERIHSTGCYVKDLEAGLLDFPARLNDEDIYFCWKVGEDRIRFYHRQSEGFAGRKPIDPRDADYQSPIQ
jgi:hypothetical protein